MRKLTIFEWIVGLITLAGGLITLVSCSCNPTINPPEIKVDLHMQPPKVEVNMPENKQPTNVYINPKTPKERRQQRQENRRNNIKTEE